MHEGRVKMVHLWVKKTFDQPLLVLIPFRLTRINASYVRLYWVHPHLVNRTLLHLPMVMSLVVEEDYGICHVDVVIR